MRGVGYLIGACFLIAVLQALVKALLVGICVTVIVGAFVRPRETFGIIGMFMVFTLIDRHPGASLGMISAMALATIIGRQG